jgi:hypothetical protein
MKTRAPLLFLFFLVSSFSYGQVNLGEVVITSQRKDSSSVIGQNTMTQLHASTWPAHLTYCRVLRWET